MKETTSISYEELMSIEKQFQKKGISNDDVKGHKIIPGKKTSKIMISCPHPVTQLRDGKVKNREIFIGTLAILIQKYTDCHLIYKTNNLNDDANYDKKSSYKDDLIKYIKKNKIEIVLDLHGFNTFKKDIEIGTYYGKTIKNNKEIIKIIYNVFVDHDITSISCDKTLCGGAVTISDYVAVNTKAIAIQFEISKMFRFPKLRLSSFINILNTFISIVKKLNNEDVESDLINGVSYKVEYDNILDFNKTSKKYENVPNSNIGLELEMGLSFSRQEFSFIQKHLKKLKNIVGDDGIFIKDFSVISDYPIEIALDPLPLDILIAKYQDIKELIKGSNNHLYSEVKYNCGIHLNFNKPKDIESAHQRLTNYILNNPQYFIYNKYKKLKIIPSYNDYLLNQKRVTSKYSFINYSKKNIIEIRNILPSLTKNQMQALCKDLLYILYFIGEESNEVAIDFITICEDVFSNISTNKMKEIIKNNEFTISNLNGKTKIK